MSRLIYLNSHWRQRDNPERVLEVLGRQGDRIKLRTLSGGSRLETEMSSTRLTEQFDCIHLGFCPEANFAPGHKRRTLIPRRLGVR